MLAYLAFSITADENEMQTRSINARFLRYTNIGTFAAQVLNSLYPSASPRFFYEAIQTNSITPIQLVPSISTGSNILNTYFDLPYIFLLEFTRSKGEKLWKSEHVYLEWYNFLNEVLQQGWRAIKLNRYQFITDIKEIQPKVQVSSSRNNQAFNLYALRFDIVLNYKHMNIYLDYDIEDPEQTLFDVIMSYQPIFNKLDNVNIGIQLSIGEHNITSESFEPIVTFDPIILDIPGNSRLAYRLLAHNPVVFIANLFGATASMINDKLDKKILSIRKRLKFRE